MFNYLKNLYKEENLNPIAREYLQKLKKYAASISTVDRKLKSRYVEEFLIELIPFEKVGTVDDIFCEMINTRFIFIGDFHIIDEYRLWEANTIETLYRNNRNIVLCVEFFKTSFQSILNRWLKSEIDDEYLINNTKFEKKWGTLWKSFKPLFDKAKHLNIPVFGIDNELRKNFRQIKTRDKQIAAKIYEIASEYPSYKIVTVIGESHLCPSHLPLFVQQQIEESLKDDLFVLIYNHETAYFQLLAEGRDSTTPAVKLKPGYWCIFSTDPLVKYEYYKAYLDGLEVDKYESEYIEIFDLVNQFLEDLCGWLEIAPDRYCLVKEKECILFLADTLPDIILRNEMESYFKSLLEHNVPTDYIKSLKTMIRFQSLCYLPDKNLLLIDRFNTPFGAQEVGRFLFNRLKKSDIDFEGSGWFSSFDTFYYGIIEDALSYYSSKLLYPLRNHFVESVFLRLEKYNLSELKEFFPLTSVEIYNISRLLKEHKEFEKNYENYGSAPSKIILAVMKSSIEMRFLQRELGFILGEQLWRWAKDNKENSNIIKNLFFTSLDIPGATTKLYMDLSLKSIEYFDLKMIRKKSSKFTQGIVPPTDRNIG